VLRRLIVAVVVVVPLFGSVGLLSSAPPAAAANNYWVAGTYQLFIQGGGGQTLVSHDVGADERARPCRCRLAALRAGCVGGLRRCSVGFALGDALCGWGVLRDGRR